MTPVRAINITIIFINTNIANITIILLITIVTCHQSICKHHLWSANDRANDSAYGATGEISEEIQSFRHKMRKLYFNLCVIDGMSDDNDDIDDDCGDDSDEDDSDDHSDNVVMSMWS